MKPHDEIKKQYEHGDYDQQIKTVVSYSNPSKLGWYQRSIKKIIPFWWILLIATFLPASYSMAYRIVWLHYLFMVLWILNTIGVIYCYFKIKKLKNSTQPK
ncbi:hypothetical protein KQH87_06680 [Ligilactobacillus animalis]|uniref:hypothetical protein n=1 Tax=Ligilactobacillus animalis TaxID=1605 RepID=UPI001C11DE7F|nr:hypothetical protein [Ligilactobacillus animalis]MBU5279552.1 hypothetical protein [Ligilactobacillus animalis]